jgi:hypothetical protein
VELLLRKPLLLVIPLVIHVNCMWSIRAARACARLALRGPHERAVSHMTGRQGQFTRQEIRTRRMLGHAHSPVILVARLVRLTPVTVGVAAALRGGRLGRDSPVQGHKVSGPPRNAPGTLARLLGPPGMQHGVSIRDGQNQADVSTGRT